MGMTMTMTMIGEAPAFPISLLWDSISETFDSLRELGMHCEYVEYEFEPTADRPIFTDARGATFRIIILAAEVVLCARVPSDYDPSQLRFVAFEHDGSEFVVEALGTQAHRALRRSHGETGTREVVRPEDLKSLSTPLRRENLAAPSMTRREFNKAWNSLVDPGLPLGLTDLVPGFIRKFFRGR